MTAPDRLTSLKAEVELLSNLAAGVLDALSVETREQRLARKLRLEETIVRLKAEIAGIEQTR